jgi:hypothetical protein
MLVSSSCKYGGVSEGHIIQKCIIVRMRQINACLKMAVFWVVALCYNAEVYHLHTHCHENLKSYLMEVY